MREVVEVFWILALGAQHRVIQNRPLSVARGILNGTLVHPRELLRLAIQANAVSIIVVHNCPSGEPTPSAEGRMMTRQLKAAGMLLGIPLRDHVVMGAGRYASFAEVGDL